MSSTTFTVATRQKACSDCEVKRILRKREVSSHKDIVIGVDSSRERS